jgi:hypothetical protein
MTAPTTHYQVLGVAPAADDATIKIAYRKLVRKHHPDLVGPSGVEMTGRINHAFSVLSNDSARRTYDRELADTLRAQSRAQEPPARPRAPKAREYAYPKATPVTPPAPAHPEHDFTYMPDGDVDGAAHDSGRERPAVCREWSTPKFVTALLLTPVGLFIAFVGWQTILAYTATAPGGGGIVLAQWAAVPAALSALFARRPRMWVWVVLGFAGVVQPIASLDILPLGFFTMGQPSNLGQAGMLAITLGFVLYRVAGREMVIRYRCRPHIPQ